MWFTLVHNGVPIGAVDLPLAGLAAGRVACLRAYGAIQPVVRVATAALLDVGVFGVAAPPRSPRSAETIRLRRALARGARLQLELRSDAGELVPTTFVNLLEAPDDGGVIAVVGVAEAPSLVGAITRGSPRGTTGQI